MGRPGSKGLSRRCRDDIGSEGFSLHLTPRGKERLPESPHLPAEPEVIESPLSASQFDLWQTLMVCRETTPGKRESVASTSKEAELVPPASTGVSITTEF